MTSSFPALADLRLSRLTFGIMRLDHATDLDGLIRRALELNVTTFHVSQEYATWPLFVDAWRRVRPKDLTGIRFIGKVGVPHFGEAGFDPAKFIGKIETYRSTLGIEALDIVQWLLRFDLAQESERARIFDRDAALVDDTVQQLKSAGRLRSLVSFPYTAPIGERALAQEWCDGLALYCNPLEQEMTSLQDQAAACGKATLAIRPFAAGRLFEQGDWSAEDAIRFPFQHDAVISVIASVSTAKHLETAADAAQVASGLKPDHV